MPDELNPVQIEQHICQIEDCAKIVIARGLCSKHYTRLRRTGSPDQTLWERRSIAQRTRNKYVVVASGCWEWQAAITTSGYGILRILGLNVMAHRALYEDRFGAVPNGLELDHLCRNRRCVNPDHLEAVTHQENVRRGTAGNHRREWAKSRLHCPRGHPFDETNSYIRPDGSRACRECSRANWRAWNERRKATR